MNHIGEKIFGGMTAGQADKRDIEFILVAFNQIRKTFNKPGLVAGIIKYPDETKE